MHKDEQIFETISADLKAVEDRRNALRADRDTKAAALEAERKARVDATIAGTPYDDNGDIARLAAEIDVVDEALAALKAKHDAIFPEYLAANKQSKIGGVERRLSEKMQEHLDLVAEAEAQALALAASLAAIERVGADMRAIRSELGGHNAFDGTRINHRIGGRLTRALTAAAPTGHYGGLSWMVEAKRAEDWRAEEANDLAREMQGTMREAESAAA